MTEFKGTVHYRTVPFLFGGLKGWSELSVGSWYGLTRGDFAIDSVEFEDHLGKLLRGVGIIPSRLWGLALILPHTEAWGYYHEVPSGQGDITRVKC